MSGWPGPITHGRSRRRARNPRLPRTLVWLSSSCSVHRRQQGKLQPYHVIAQRVLERQALSAIPQAGRSFRLHTNHPPRGGIPSAPPCASLSSIAWVTNIEHPNGRGRPTGRFPGPCFSAIDGDMASPHLRPLPHGWAAQFSPWLCERGSASGGAPPQRRTSLPGQAPENRCNPPVSGWPPRGGGQQAASRR